MNLQDTLFNWLQISIVAEARPEDGAARETKDFFRAHLTGGPCLEPVLL